MRHAHHRTIAAGPPAWKMVAASLVIVSVLVLQGGVILNRLGRFVRAPNLWPFIDYPMYREAYHLGDALPRYALVGLTADGREVGIPLKALGMTIWQFEENLLLAIQQGDDAAVRRYAHLYEQRSGRRLRGVRLENHPLVLTRAGMTPAPVEQIRTVIFPDTEEPRP